MLQNLGANYTGVIFVGEGENLAIIPMRDIRISPVSRLIDFQALIGSGI